MKTEMATKPKQKDKASPDKQPVALPRPTKHKQPSPSERRLAGLKAREAGLKAKIDRISTFNADTREQSLERAQTHLEQIQAEIKKASQ